MSTGKHEYSSEFEELANYTFEDGTLINLLCTIGFSNYVFNPSQGMKHVLLTVQF